MGPRSMQVLPSAGSQDPGLLTQRDRPSPSTRTRTPASQRPDAPPVPSRGGHSLGSSLSEHLPAPVGRPRASKATSHPLCHDSVRAVAGHLPLPARDLVCPRHSCSLDGVEGAGGL